jgi:hypothetical protein
MNEIVGKSDYPFIENILHYKMIFVDVSFFFDAAMSSRRIVPPLMNPFLLAIVFHSRVIGCSL